MSKIRFSCGLGTDVNLHPCIRIVDEQQASKEFNDWLSRHEVGEIISFEFIDEEMEKVIVGQLSQEE